MKTSTAPRCRRGATRTRAGTSGSRRNWPRSKKEYDELKEKDREFFDLERLTNPYADTRILNGAPETEVQTIIVGIDMEVGELVLADRLREKRRLDLVLTHHPEGRALAKLGDVMGMQADILHSVGVPIATAEALLNVRIGEVSRRLLPVEPHPRRRRRAPARAALHVRAHPRGQPGGLVPAEDLRHEAAGDRRRGASSC